MNDNESDKLAGIGMTLEIFRGSYFIDAIVRETPRDVSYERYIHGISWTRLTPTSSCSINGLWTLNFIHEYIFYRKKLVPRNNKTKNPVTQFPTAKFHRDTRTVEPCSSGINSLHMYVML